MFRTCNVFQPLFSKSHSRVQISQKSNFGTFLGYVIFGFVGGDPGIHNSRAALRSDSRAIATNERASRHPQVCTRLFPEYPVGDNRQKRHAQLFFHHERDYYKAKNWIRANHTGPRGEELDRKPPEDCAPYCGLLIRKPDICGKIRNLIFVVHGF